MPRHLLAYGVTFALLVGCAPGGEERAPVAKVEQATVDDRVADDLFGQSSFSAGTEPTFTSNGTAQRPLLVATDPLFRTKVPPLYVWFADVDAHRVVALQSLGLNAVSLRGQVSWTSHDANPGGTPTASSLSSPSGVAVGGAFLGDGSFGYMAIADTGNHRVLIGSGALSFGWTPWIVLGQQGSFTTGVRNDGGVSWTSMADPQGVAFDGDPANPSRDPRVYVTDTGNHRVLIFNMGSTAAAFCVGQPDCNHGDPDGGGTVSASGFDTPIGIATYNAPTDPLNGFYVADSGNHRVLHFRSIVGSADVVFGQGGDFTSAVPSKGGVSASSLRGPSGVAVDASGGLYVADTGHHRVLHFPKGKTVADRVYGQPDFTTAVALSPPTSTSLRAPTGVAVLANGDLVVADTGNARVLRYRQGCTGSCDDGNPCTDDYCDPVSGCTHLASTWPHACAPYRCDAVAKACIRTCSTSTPGWCQSPALCENGLCVVRCFSDAECASGQCDLPTTGAQGFCCDRPCHGPCESCSVPGFEGTCRPIAPGPPRSDRHCEVEVSGDCGTSCDGVSGTCVIASPGAPCGVEACIDGEALGFGTCDGKGACTSQTTSCAPYGCAANGCRTSCRFDADCAPGVHCFAGSCGEGAGATAGGEGCEVAPGNADPVRGLIFSAMVLMALGATFARRRR